MIGPYFSPDLFICISIPVEFTSSSFRSSFLRLTSWDSPVVDLDTSSYFLPPAVSSACPLGYDRGGIRAGQTLSHRFPYFLSIVNRRETLNLQELVRGMTALRQ